MRGFDSVSAARDKIHLTLNIYSRLNHERHYRNNAADLGKRCYHPFSSVTERYCGHHCGHPSPEAQPIVGVARQSS